MSETSTAVSKTPSVVEAISGVIDQWLTTEVLNSQIGNNAVLADYEGFREQQLLPFDDSKNVLARKSEGHFERLKDWTDELFAKGADSDEMLARLSFGALMGAAGSFRVQCLLLSQSKEEYSTRWHSGNEMGVHADTIVAEHLSSHFDTPEPTPTDMQRETMSREELVAETHRVNQLRDEIHKRLWQGKPFVDLRKVVAVWSLAELRREWVGLATEHIIYAAQKHDGNLAEVSLFEPKSITYAEVVYPFANEPPYFTQPAQANLQATDE